MNIAAGAFGGSTGGVKKNLRKQYEMRDKYSGTHLPNLVKNAKAAGLHPLFALGASGAQGPSFQMQGQSETGSFASKGLRSAAQGLNQYARYKELIEAQADLSKARTTEALVSNDQTQQLSETPRTQAAASAGLAEYKPAEIGAHVKGRPTETGSTRSVMTGIRIGNQTIQFPIEEPDQLMEDPAAALLGAYLYGGNRHVDWGKAARQYMDIRAPFNYKNRAESVTRKKILWGLASIARHWKRSRGQGR